MKCSLNSLSLVLFILLIGTAQPAQGQEAAPLVVMNLAAHPDDEDGRTLTYYRRAKNAIAYSVIYTRGEGGQNEIGPELYEDLGAIRTDETERAARILGTQTYFLNFKDFGYSKKASEAFAFWGGQDQVTSRLVYLVRKLKPDVIFTNHDTLTVGPRVQHGQHQAVGISAYDAFTLAADASYHPEQLEEPGVDLWQPKRLFLRRWRGGEEQHDVVIPVTDIDETAGKSYSKIATEALGEHASQGMGMFASFRRMQDNTYFSLLHSATEAALDSTDLAGNLPPNTANNPNVRYWLDSQRLPKPPEGFLLPNDEVVVAGQSLKLRADASMFDVPVHVTLSGPIDTMLAVSGNAYQESAVRVLSNAQASIPKPTYQYNRFLSSPPVVYAVSNAETGELLAADYLRLHIAPQVVITTIEDVIRLRPGKNEIDVLLSQFDAKAEVLDVQLAVTRDDNRTVVFQKPFTFSFAETTILAEKLAFNLPAAIQDGNYTISITGLPSAAVTEVEPAIAFVDGRIFSVDVVEGLKVGVIESYDNTLARALSELDVDYVLLDSMALANNQLDGLHTILVDIRAYLVRQDLRTYNASLLDWVENGGQLVVNYQKTFEWNEGYPDPFDREVKNLGNFPPYPITLSRNRVTTEDSPVSVLAPELPLFNQPNVIDATLWDGWVQERGLYFPGEYDTQYKELFEMNDPGEGSLRSSTLVTPYGAGTYMYTALGWYRQLKVYHPGVYAFFANLISQPLVDGQVASP
ncbi:MAG: PIG-L family deacetylase [Bacteroidota bacterium]